MKVAVPLYLKFYKDQGFTIIEVMIVVVIAGLILLIVFLAVPAVQRDARNYDRKNYTGLINTQLLEYYNNSGHYPGDIGAPGSAASDAEICTFLQSLPRVRSGASCGNSNSSSTSINGTISEDCMTIQAKQYTICYQDWTSVNHGYIGPNDEIVITLAHWCNVGQYADLSQPVTFPVAGDDANTKRYAVWTALEDVKLALCFDSIPGA